MSEISDRLWLRAQELEKAASDKTSGWQMIKSASIKALEVKGVSTSDTETLLEKLAERAYPDLSADKIEASTLLADSKLFEKVAQYVDELEDKINTMEGLRKEANAAERAPSVDALSGTGVFTSDDLETLGQLDNSTLSKVASMADQTPWNLGEPSDRMGGGQDALSEFLLS